MVVVVVGGAAGMTEAMSLAAAVGRTGKIEMELGIEEEEEVVVLL